MLLSRPRRLALCTLGFFLVPVALDAGEASPGTKPFIPGYNRFYLDSKAAEDAERGGTLLLQELGCVLCHASPRPPLAGKQAPILTDVGTRVKRGYFKRFLLDPQATKPHSNMPNVLAGLPEAEREAAAEALAHFLASTGATRVDRPAPKAVALGRATYEQVGCVACHGTRDAKAEQTKITATSIPLGDLTAKYTLASLASFLENPHAVRPSGRMPGLLNSKEANDIASFLLQGVGLDLAAASTKFSYYEGAWTTLPDFDKLKPKLSGIGPAFDIGLAPRLNNMGFKFEGFIKIDKEGQYKFWLASDDGSKLFINGKLIVNNDGIHPPATVTASTFLAKGLHPLVVTFFNAGGGAELKVEVQGAGAPKQNLAALIKLSDMPEVVKKKEKDKSDFDLDKSLVARGRHLFTTIGCVNCHEMKEAGKVIFSAHKAPPLADLKAGAGCLSADPGKAPHYTLPAKAKSDIVAAIARIKKGPAVLSEGEKIHRSFVAFNCYACHERDKIGGPEEAWNATFTTTQPEMGDEARIPPSLTGVGAKMPAAYLKHIFANGVDDRPYMHTRMPKFGMENVGFLIDAFASLDKLEPIPTVKFGDTPAKVKSEARHMVGALALGCIKCHTFNGTKAEGVQGIDMTLMPKRVTREWFHHYMLTPMKLRPGTRMPEMWPKGKTLLPKVLGGDTASQIESIFVYLQDGKLALMPLGLKKQFIPLVAEKDAIIYRNFIQGAGARAIGVGYPEHANLAFDANDIRLAMIWQGAFIDASRHWTDRGVGFEPPLGDNILNLPGGPAFARLETLDSAWPGKSAKELGQRFKGYRLAKDQRPTFLYEVEGLAVEDFPNPSTGKEGLPGFKRTLTIMGDKGPADLCFRAAAADKIETLKDGWFASGGWRMRIRGAEARVRAAPGGRMELIVPVTLKAGKAQIVQEIEW